MRVLYWILGLGFGVGLMSCDTKTEPDLGNWSTVVVEPVDDATFLFDGSILRTYELRVSDENLAFLNDDPVAEAYVSATLDFEGETFTDVGLRYKGSIGAFVGCTEQNGFPPQETKTCVKLSMKVKMDFTEDGGNFFGLRKLQFHSMNSDQSLMRERLGYALFREMGVTSPRTAPVRLVINGEFAGLFLLVEQIDRSFTRARFGDGGEGNIYKEIWPVHNQQELYTTALRNKGGVDRSVERIQLLLV